MGKGQVDKLNGYQMRFEHYRYPRGGDMTMTRYHRGRSLWPPAERGGHTMCYIEDEAGTLLGLGVARCSMKDAFCYRIGREIARGRALKVLTKRRAEQT